MATVWLAKEAVKLPPVTVTGVPAPRPALADVTLGVHDAGAAVPPAMAIGALTSLLPLLMPTTMVPSVPVKAHSSSPRRHRLRPERH